MQYGKHAAPANVRAQTGSNAPSPAQAGCSQITASTSAGPSSPWSDANALSGDRKLRPPAPRLPGTDSRDTGQRTESTVILVPAHVMYCAVLGSAKPTGTSRPAASSASSASSAWKRATAQCSSMRVPCAASVSGTS